MEESETKSTIFIADGEPGRSKIMDEISLCCYSSLLIMTEIPISVHRFVRIPRLDCFQNDLFEQEHEMDDMTPTNGNKGQEQESYGMLLRERHLHIPQISIHLSLMTMENKTGCVLCEKDLTENTQSKTGSLCCLCAG